MTIVTQTNDLVNYQSISKISIVEGTVTDEDDTQNSVYVIFAFDVIAELVENEYEDNGISLGVYRSYDECQSIVSQLIGSIGADDKVFVMPQPR